MKSFFLASVCMLLAANSTAQVKGVLLDSTTRKPLEKAVVGLVVHAAHADTSYFFADDKGYFSISPVPASDFSLIFSRLNYTTVARFVPSRKGLQQLNLGDILLAQRPVMLGEAIVQAAPIVIKEDTVEYRADAFKVKENASTEDLLKKLPGISVDKDGNVKAQGKDVKKIRVNGKDFFGGDVQTATRELPANIIDKIQVIDDYGDQATVSGIKDGDPDKIINLQIKKDKNKGFFGRVTAGGGTEDRYQASFNGNYFNNDQQISLFANSNNINQSLFNFGNFNMSRGLGSLMKAGQSMMNDLGGGSGFMNAMQNGDQSFLAGGLNTAGGITTSNSIGTNYRDQWGKKISVYGSYSFAHRDNDAEQVSASQNLYGTATFQKNQQYLSATQSDNHRFFFNLEYQADAYNYLKVSPAITYAVSNTSSQTQFGYYNTTSKTSDGSLNSGSSNESPNFSGTILYNHKFRKKGRNFSANLSLGSSSSDADQTTRNQTYTYLTPAGFLYRSQYINQANDNYNYGIRLTYSEPVSKTRSIDMAVSHNLNYARNNKRTDSIDAGGYKFFLPAFSNDYENDFYNNRIGVSMRTTKKKYNYTIGVSVQPVSQQGYSLTRDSAYKTIHRTSVFPIARFAYNFSKARTFNLSYSGNATQPTYTQLQDVLDVSNPQLQTKGNPALKPAINHNVNITYNNFNFVTGKVIFTNLTVSTIQNQIVNDNIQKGSTGAQLSIPQNVNGFYNVLAFYMYSRPYRIRKYVLTVTGNVNYNHNISLVNSTRITGQNWIASQGVTLEFNLKDWLSWGNGVTYSLNDNRFSKPAFLPAGSLPNSFSSSWLISSNINIDFPHNWVLKYDFDYTLNQGLSSSVSANQAILNASIEKQLFRKKNGIIRLSGNDLFNQQTSVGRTVNANSVVDSRGNLLTRYFLLSFTYRLQRFKGIRPKNQGFRGMGAEPKNAEIKVF